MFPERPPNLCGTEFKFIRSEPAGGPKPNYKAIDHFRFRPGPHGSRPHTTRLTVGSNTIELDYVDTPNGTLFSIKVNGRWIISKEY